jgi:uncharacterized phage protein gp47/JayE
MPFERPTLVQLRDRTATDIERHSGQDATSRGSAYAPIAKAQAGLAHGLHGHLAWIADQLFDDTADDANLLRRAAEMGITRIPAARASGTATATGNDGAVIPAETLLQTDDEILYRVTAEASIVAGTATLQLTAVEPGAAGNQAAGVTLRFISPVLDVDSEATVVEITSGADIEPITRVRERLAERRTNPPMGGNSADYIAWAKAAHVDVTRAWCYPNENGLGTVVVRFVTDDLSTPIPTQAHVEAVTDYTDQVRPAGMKAFNVYAPVAKSLDITFTALSPNTPTVRAAIEAELKDLISREGEPGGTLLLTHINEAISLATGETDHRHDLVDDFTCATGEFPVLGALTWPA